MRYVKILALMMLMLVLTLPVGFAVSISGIGFGQDQAEGLIRPVDTVTLVVDVEDFAVGATTDNVFYNPITGREAFDSCIGNQCTKVLDLDSYEGRPHDFKVDFLALGIQESTTITLITDTIGADIDSVSVNGDVFSPETQVVFTIQTSDEACSVAQCVGKCSGIKRIEVLNGGRVVAQKDIFGTSCSETTSAAFLVKDLASNDGRAFLTFRAIDNFENLPGSVGSAIITVDSTAPGLPANEFALEKGGVVIKAYGFPEQVDFVMGVGDPFVSISIDMTELGAGVTNVITCSETECRKTITINLGDVTEGRKTLTVPVTLTDELGSGPKDTSGFEVTSTSPGVTVPPQETSDNFRDSTAYLVILAIVVLVLAGIVFGMLKR